MWGFDCGPDNCYRIFNDADSVNIGLRMKNGIRRSYDDIQHEPDITFPLINVPCPIVDGKIMANELYDRLTKLKAFT